MQLRPTFTLRNLLPTDHAGNSKTKAARCQSAAILTKTFSLEAISLTFKEKREDYLTLTVTYIVCHFYQQLKFYLCHYQLNGRICL